ncbi:MAG: hypothetical protein O3B01_15985 [Planctomycetota bacterium]|nr:hypothetical protein [Planctomycetota bacterium]MDA1140074.1 hypothetical protein [Planctomycetota bacterium]
MPEIDDSEVLLRRIPKSANLFDPDSGAGLSPMAFRPNPNDTTGISLSRQSVTAPEKAAAQGREGKDYYIGKVTVGALRAAGLTVVSKPLEDDPGHVEIPELNYDNRKSDNSLEIQVKLAHELCSEVVGPFPGQKAQS